MTVAANTGGAARQSDIEVRLHGRGGQGGVTCAKILAAVYAKLGKSVQTFGDYAGERSGAPVRAYTRVSDRPIENRNKVYEPHHLLVLDPTLLADDIVAGLVPGGLLLLNTTKPLTAFADRFQRYRLAVVDATAIARRHKIGTRSVVIVNTTIAGAFVRALALPFEALEHAYQHLGLLSNLAAAREAHEAVAIRVPAAAGESAAASPVVLAQSPRVVPLVEHGEGPPTGLRTGNWRTQTPRYVHNLAPCSAFCPAGNDVIGFLQALAREGEAAAARVLGQTTPLAGVCGRVCPAPCMEGCNRREHDGSVNIRGLERWISDNHPVAQPADELLAPAHRYAVVGGGPAGLAAAYTLARRGQRVTLCDVEAELGGVLRTGIPPYRLPREVLDREIAGVLALGVEAKLGQRFGRAELAELEKAYDAVVVCTGLQSLRGLGGEGGELGGVEQGIDFLHRMNLVGHERTSGHVVVLGGGNTAMDCARSALRAGATRVTVAYRRSRSEMPAIAEEIDEAAHEGVELRFLRQPLGFTGEGRVTGVVLAEVELGPPDASGRRRPITTERKETLACDAVLLALGQSADFALLPDGHSLVEGVVHVAGEARKTFVAGDLATGDGTVAHAIGDGRRAATQAMRALGLPVEVFRRPDRARSVPVTDIRLDHFDHSDPARERQLPVALRTLGFAEVSQGLADGLEAHRCFSCGECTRCDTCLIYCPEGVIRRAELGYEVDYSYCKGCGICVTECPRKAMEMVDL